MQNKQEILDNYLKTHDVPAAIAEKLSVGTFTTPNFAYRALRIGNSIGDALDIGLTLVLADAITQFFGLTVYTIENCEFHTRDVTESDLDKLVHAAEKFEQIRHGAEYKRQEKEAREFFMRNMKSIIG